MVVYDLLCSNDHRFEGWFPSFDEYQRQLAEERISCPVCGSTKVEKLPHACAVISSRGEREPAPPVKPHRRPLTEAEARELLFRLHQHVVENFEDVGSRFAEEARAIFYGRVEPRPIHGTATAEEREDLDEEGIPYLLLPKPKLDS
ncbi:MAG TPA: DUF1178 family protein [Candidatus Acidoferrales bacterium]|nr:DUF1178 family protein [Candidatus Acidoferrales bacterium]